MKILKFNYYDEFACTGPVCEDSCCKHWAITLTRKEYIEYKRMDCSPELKEVMGHALMRLKSGNDNQYARMALYMDGRCPFLGKDKLCMIQKEKGESALTVVCSSFPRNWERVGLDAAVFTLTPTCYHVVELLMNHPEGLVLSEEEYDRKNKWINSNRWTGGLLPPSSVTFPYIWQIKTAQLDILQNREFTIPERMLILGYYTQKVCDYLESSPEKIEQLSAMMLDSELCRKIADSLKTPQSEAEAAAKSIDILQKTALSVNTLGVSRHLADLVKAIADYLELGYVKGENGENIIRWNTENCTKNREIYRKIEEERPYIIENLMVSLAFEKLSRDGNELWADYFSLVALYNFLKTVTAAFLPEDYTDTQLALGITKIVKIVLNADVAKTVILKDFADNNAATLPYAAFLIS